MDINLKAILKGINSEDLFDNHPDAIIVINYQKSIVYWNKRAQQIFGFYKREVNGRDISTIFDSEQGDVYNALREGGTTVLKGKSRLNKNLYIEVNCADMPVRNEIIISARDVTRNHLIFLDLLNEFEKLKNINQNKSSFIANLSHELRTPMHSIIGFSQALMDGLGGKLVDKQEKYVSIIGRNANSLLNLLNSLLDLSKIEAGKMEFHYKVFDVTQVINLASETVVPFAEEKKLNFTVDLSDLVRKNCYSEENILRQALVNILNNAVKFTDVGSVRLKVYHPDLEFVKECGINVPFDYTDKSYLMFAVTDTGIGIAEKELDGIFDEYRQIDRSLTKKHGGSGLGLAITKKIIAELGGVIWAESELGQGTTFSFIIPVEKPAD